MWGKGSWGRGRGRGEGVGETERLTDMGGRGGRMMVYCSLLFPCLGVEVEAVPMRDRAPARVSDVAFAV